MVGAGAGATFSAGTAWAADLGGAAGVTRAGVFLTLGFATGPVVSGVLAEFAPAPLVVPFVLSAVLSLAAVAAAPIVPGRIRHPPPQAVHPAAHPPAGPARAPRSVGARAELGTSGGSLGIGRGDRRGVTLPARVPANDGGPLLAGIAAGIVLGTGVVVQACARCRNLGPGAGVVGASAAAAGLLLAGFGGSHPAGWWSGWPSCCSARVTDCACGPDCSTWSGGRRRPAGAV